LHWRRRGILRGVQSAGPFHKVDTAQNKEQRSGDRGQSAGPEELRETVPPRLNGWGDEGQLIPDNSFGFQLGTERNPDAIGRVNLSRNALGGDSDGGKVSEQILTGRATGEMLACFRRKRAKLFLFQNGFKFLTLHTANSAGCSADWLSLPNSSKVAMRVPPSSTFFSF
jgi:hypothetical protein